MEDLLPLLSPCPLLVTAFVSISKPQVLSSHLGHQLLCLLSRFPFRAQPRAGANFILAVSLPHHWETLWGIQYIYKYFSNLVK